MESLVKNRYTVVKNVNNGPNYLYIGAYDTEAEAVKVAEDRLAFHMERCPGDRVEFVVSTPWSVKRIHNGDTV